MSAAPRPSLLPHFLAALYTFAIVYASLQPFAPWIAPDPGTPFFLFGPWRVRWTRFDFVVNALAYLPLGFFVALVPRRRPPFGRLSVAMAAGVALSFAMETLQMFLPPRDANAFDLVANTAGTLAGGLVAVVFVRSATMRGAIRRARERWFLPGRVGDLGVALLAIWLAVQINPGIPLFAAVYEPTPPLGPAVAGSAGSPDAAAVIVTAAHSAFQLLGVGLFLALLLRERRLVGGAVMLLVGAALLVKGVAATALLKPAVWEQWLSPGVSMGVAGGALLLMMAIFAARPVQVALCAIALLSSLVATLFAPDLLHTRPPLAQFNAPYGHLSNFNGLTHTVLLAWPIAATAFLFALAGRPRWGEPH